MDKKVIIASIVLIVVLATFLLTTRKKEEIPSEDNKKTVETQKETVGDKEMGKIEDGKASTQAEVEEHIEDVPQNIDASGQENVTADEINQKMNIEIVEMVPEIEKTITDMDAFSFAIKEMFYKTGIMEKKVKCLNRITYDYKDNLIYYQMYVSSSTFTHFEVVYDVKKNTYQVFVS